MATRLPRTVKGLWRNPQQHGSLYLFVIKNSSDQGMYVGTVNTYRMLENLGRGRALPAATRDAWIERDELVGTELDQYKAHQSEVDAGKQNIKRLEAERQANYREVHLLADALRTAQAITQRYEGIG